MRETTSSAWRIARRLAVALICFLVGLFIAALAASLDKPAMPAPPVEDIRLVAPPSQTSSRTNDAECGAQQQQALAANAGERPLPPQIPSLSISPERLLVTDSRTSMLYMLDRKGRIVWRWSGESISVEPFIINQPIHIGDTIHVFGRDMIHVTLDVLTGAQKEGGGSYGSGDFTQATAYKDGLCLVVFAYDGGTQGRAASFIQFYKGHEMHWQEEFPRGAVLKVWRGKIYALSFKAEGVEAREIAPPPPADHDDNC